MRMSKGPTWIPLNDGLGIDPTTGTAAMLAGRRRRARRRRLVGSGPVPRRPRVMVDLEPLRASRDLRLLVLGNFVSGLGTQAALVALPYQLYVQTGSAFLTGLLGAVELIPLVTMALLGGAIADRTDRRRVLLLDQIALVACPARWRRSPSPARRRCGHALRARRPAGRVRRAAERDLRSAILPNLVEPARLRSALALNFGLYQLTMVIGPGLGGVLIGVLGVGAAYTIDAVSCLAMVWRRGGDGAPAAADRRRRAPAGPALDRRRPALRARQPGARGLVRDRPRGHDLRHAARAVRRARGQRLPRGRGGHRPALRGGLGGRDRRRADHGLDRARPAPGDDRHLGRGRVGRGDRRSWASSARCGRPRRCSPSPAPPTASAPSVAARSTRWSPRTPCAGACRRSSRWW